MKCFILKYLNKVKLKYLIPLIPIIVPTIALYFAALTLYSIFCIFFPINLLIIMAGVMMICAELNITNVPILFIICFWAGMISSLIMFKSIDKFKGVK